VSVSATVHQVHAVLRRADALFGEPTTQGLTALDADLGLTGAGQWLRWTRRQMSGQLGVLATEHASASGGAVQALDAATDADTRLRRTARRAGRVDGSGWANSHAVLSGARRDAAGLIPASATPAGQRALVATLRARIAEQQQLVHACQVRDARLATMLRTLAYPGAERARSSAMPKANIAFGSGPASGSVGRSPAWGGLDEVVRPLLARGYTPKPSDMSGFSAPGVTAGTPLGALTPDSSPREVAAAIIHEARQRGYSPAQTTAILADGMQESNLSPRAVSPNKLWVSIFQQDASYPGRCNPNLAIAEFFDRLDGHGGPSSPDIWKSIFWLQQRPGEPSADAAYAHGRQAYLREMQAQHQRAVAMYRSIVG
jgi:hypothetical protein